ncbi:MAG: PmoA family protein, partial [Chloroflexi bacterium]|nr:PmoA family protein [Chloroflexota bacterium]
MEYFTVISDPDASPYETTSHTRRLKVIWRDKIILALSQGVSRAYVYPVFTPAGMPVTAEAPIDHAHHQSITIGTYRLDMYSTE